MHSQTLLGRKNRDMTEHYGKKTSEAVAVMNTHNVLTHKHAHDINRANGTKLPQLQMFSHGLDS